MKILLQGIVTLLLVLPSGCHNTNTLKQRSDTTTQAIELAISDFYSSNILIENHKIFAVAHTEVLQLVKLMDDPRKTDNIYQSLISVIITADALKLSEDVTSKIGTKGITIPSRYIEKNGNLFFWWDSNYAFTEETYNTYKTYGVIDDNLDSKDNPNQLKEGVKYYFCTKDLTKFITLKPSQDINSIEPLPLLCN
ncbi:hypothetical protein [Winogradskyella sp.]|uniref:hypothetical protein n=1 Tax=Winogradskyella sp. TaxID=1883156 RepID=UPI003F6B22AD